MVDKFNCPNCGSGRTKPVSLIVSSGTRTRSTLGASSRKNIWGSSSTYKSKLVESLGERPSNSIANVCIVLGVVGMLLAFAIWSSASRDDGSIGAVFSVPAGILLLIGFGARSPREKLLAEQNVWDKQWFCSRCGHKWVAG